MVAVIVNPHDMPDNCDTCNAPVNAFLEPVFRTEPTAFGEVKTVVGYLCHSCNNTHLYR